MAGKKSGKVGSVHETTIIMTPKTTLEELAKAKRDTKKRTQSMSGTLGEKIAKAVEEKHLDRTAFSIACRLEGMDDERLHRVWHNLLYYAEALGIEKRANAQQKLFTGDEENEPTAKFGDKASDDGKVTPIGKAARAVTEAAGA